VVAKRRRLSYSWALRLSEREIRQLSGEGRRGVHYAAELALNASERSRAALDHDEVLPNRLTPADLAEVWESPVKINSAIKQARVELFGRDLSRSAIAYRLQHRRHDRRCAEPGCEHEIDPLAHGNTRYCDMHASGKARATRHRRTRSHDR
jgi:hypothetical protein